jgi:hypothetical protein
MFLKVESFNYNDYILIYNKELINNNNNEIYNNNKLNLLIILK